MISGVEIRLIAASAIHAGAQIIRYEQFGGALKKLKGAPVTINPVRQLLAGRGIGEGVITGAQSGKEDRGRARLAAGAVREGNLVAGSIHKHLLARPVILAEHHVLLPVPEPI